MVVVVVAAAVRVLAVLAVLVVLVVVVVVVVGCERVRLIYAIPYMNPSKRRAKTGHVRSSPW